MKAVFVKGRNVVSVDEVQAPKMISKGDVLVKMRACGLCGSDLEKIYGEYGMSSGRLGHEPAGEVVAVGEGVTNFRPGDRVFIHHHVACYSCHYCLHGDHTMCPAYQTSNISPCGLAEQFLVPEWNVSRGGLINLHNNISFDEAALVEPLACCIRAINKSNFQKGDDVAVFGAGPAGLMNVILAKAFGAGRIFVIDINDFRINIVLACQKLKYPLVTWLGESGLKGDYDRVVVPVFYLLQTHQFKIGAGLLSEPFFSVASASPDAPRGGRVRSVNAG